MHTYIQDNTLIINRINKWPKLLRHANGCSIFTRLNSYIPTHTDEKITLTRAHTHRHTHTHIYIYVCVCAVYVDVCVRVCEYVSV